MITTYCTICKEANTWGEFEDGICDGCWYTQQQPTTADEARELAIDWQQWQSEQSLSYYELAAHQAYFEALAYKFDLVDEFKENAII